MRGVAEKVVAITGGGGGLGRAYALRLGAGGAKVAIVDVNPAAARAVSDEVRDNGGRGEAFIADLTRPEEVAATMSAISRSLGVVDVLVNNAGGVTFVPAAMEHITFEHWTRSLAINLTSNWLCTQAVVPAMKSARRGKIVNVSTTIFSQGYPTNLAPYVAAKGGVVALTRTLAKELGPFGITVNAIAPGVIPHKLTGDQHKDAAAMAFVDVVVKQQAVQRIGVPADLCGTVEFLASDESDFITGQVINVDGGWALGT